MNAPATFIDDASQLLGPRGFTTDAEVLEPWLTDWRGRYTGRALGMASPASTNEVAALVKLCAAHGIPIVPQGGNSGMSGGATPDDSGRSVLLSLRRMDRIRTIDRDTRQVECEAGVILQHLHEAATEHGLRFPLTLGGKGSATIGGLISTNAGGTQVLRHGTMREQVVGLEAVLADGSIFNALVPLKKDNRGFDLKQLLIGSEGTLGVVTAATLRLVPQIGGRVVLWAGLSSLALARQFLILIQSVADDSLESFEVLPAHSLAAVLSHLPDTRAPLTDEHGWHVLVELVAPEGKEDALPAVAQDLLTRAYEDGMVEDATISTSEAQCEALWLLRDSISAAERAIGPAMQHDISVPVARMADFVESASAMIEARFPGTQAIAFGHLGDGNVHFHVLAPNGSVRGEWESADGKAVSAYVHDLVTQWGGSISAEHGIGQMKRDELARLGDPVSLATMRAIKQALDPQGLLNPGKLVPPLAPAQTSP